MFWTLPPLFLSGAAMAGAIALISVFANFGGIIGPVVIGWLKTTTNSFSGGLYYVARCAFVSAIVIVMLPSSWPLANTPDAAHRHHGSKPALEPTTAPSLQVAVADFNEPASRGAVFMS
jgi:hypothetical protein